MRDKSLSSQESLISLSPYLIFRTAPFYFVTYCPFCNLIGLQYMLYFILLGERERAHLVVQLRLFFYIFIGRAGASPPSRTAAIILFIYIRVVRRALNLLRASFSPIFQYFSAVNLTRVSFSLIFPNLYSCMRIRQPRKVPSTLIVTFESKKCCSSSFVLACYSQPVLS